MTCIVGFANEKMMVLAGDSAGVSGYDIVVRNDPKVFSVRQVDGPNVLIGFAGSFRMGQLLMTLHVPKDTIGDQFSFMVQEFIPRVRKLFTQGGFMAKENGREEGGMFLVGYRGKLFTVGYDFQVGEVAEQYDSIGCGESFALGALDVLLRQKEVDPEKALITALEVAEKRSLGVRRPWRMVGTKFEPVAKPGKRKAMKKKARKKKAKKKR